MAKAKKKLLPKNFQELLEEADIEKLKAVFDTCDVNARSGFEKQTALAFDTCPDELARWLVEQGADLSAPNLWGKTPLQTRAGHWRSNIKSLLDLGAPVNVGAGEAHGTPLHEAAAGINTPNARLLIEYGADVNALNRAQLNPLELALHECSNAQLERMPELAEVLLAAGVARTPRMKAWVEKLGAQFEFHREAFDPASVDATSAALQRLYSMFQTNPAPRRRVHDGVSAIVVEPGPWRNQHSALWDWLVPSQASAATVQGEVVRLTGRIERELIDNGAANWDEDFNRMADALIGYFQLGTPLPAAALAQAAQEVAKVKQKSGNPAHLAELAVDWVRNNPGPMKLPAPAYKR